LGLNPHLVRHGLPREVFFANLADNALEILRGRQKRPRYSSLRSVSEVAELALSRWVRPRAQRDNTYRLFLKSTLNQVLERRVAAWTLRVRDTRRRASRA
jgi:hypothetical protein